jgi:hypothetical protein
MNTDFEKERYTGWTWFGNVGVPGFRVRVFDAPRMT